MNPLNDFLKNIKIMPAFKEDRLTCYDIAEMNRDLMLLTGRNQEAVGWDYIVTHRLAPHFKSYRARQWISAYDFMELMKQNAARLSKKGH